MFETACEVFHSQADTTEQEDRGWQWQACMHGSPSEISCFCLVFLKSRARKCYADDGRIAEAQRAESDSKVEDICIGGIV